MAFGFGHNSGQLNSLRPVYINSITGEPVFAVHRRKGTVPGCVSAGRSETLLESMGLSTVSVGDDFVTISKMYRDGLLPGGKNNSWEMWKFLVDNLGKKNPDPQAKSLLRQCLGHARHG